MDNPQVPERPEPVKPETTDAVPVDDAQLSFRAWLTRNGPVVLLFVLALVLGYQWLGPQGLLNALLVLVGLGLVIFIHELGHFLVAKWCDVNVQTFSIGFGPALPGCSFQWGETTYKVALFPLGGYVKMLGEGENDEEDTDPRSYKNKRVGQRMAIISAGVIMNVVLGLICFVVAFTAGVHQMAPDIGVLEAGGPAWTKRVRSGDMFTRVDDITHPYFEDLRMAVMLTGPRDSVQFVFDTPGQEPRTVNIEPRKSSKDSNPLIGASWAWDLKLADKSIEGSDKGKPVLRGSSAAAARVLDVQPGDQVLAATDPDHPQPGDQLQDLRSSLTFACAKLAELLRRLPDQELTLRVKRTATGKEETIKVPPIGFQFEDEIIGTSDDPDNPFLVKELPYDERDPQHRHRDFFEFLRRMNKLQDCPVVIQVRRKKEDKKGDSAGPLVNVFVPPAYHRVLPGVRMVMGLVSGVREGSSADLKGVKVRDIITRVELTDGKDRLRLATNKENKDDQELDPLRLPSDLRRWAAGRTGVKARITVKRDQKTEQQKPLTLEEDLPWEASWQYDEEKPLGLSLASLSIPELGIAYQVKTAVDDVSSKDQVEGGLKKGDVILAVYFQQPPHKPGLLARLFGQQPAEGPSWNDKPTFDLRVKDDPDPMPAWAYVFYRMQDTEYGRVKLLVHRANEGEKEIEVDLKEMGPHSGNAWPLHDPLLVRGMSLPFPEDRIAQAATFPEAVRMGCRHTFRTIVQIYMSLKSLVTGRVSVTEGVTGPIGIARIAFLAAGRDWADLTVFIGMISVNLAVINFLPIPILDGGHMVFLIYEKLRGRPASETLRLAANWFGLLLLVPLILFVVYLDIVHIFWPK